jgi:hypothetical protein
MVSFGAFNIDFSRVFSSAFAADYGVYITSRNITVFLASEVSCYSFFRKITNVCFDFSLVD